MTFLHRYSSSRRLIRVLPVKIWPLLCLAILALFTTGCYNSDTGRVDVGGEINFKLPVFPASGGNAVQIFTEMHYQPSYHIQENPRILPPENSIPVTGGEVMPATLDEYAELNIPPQVLETYDPAEAERLYEINCQVCHGANLMGDGPITQIQSARPDDSLAYSRGPFPANLTLEQTRTAANGELFAFISLGGRQGASSRLRDSQSGSPMPEFRLLLTEEERWMLVEFLRRNIEGQ
jgi:hypothetical protein